MTNNAGSVKWSLKHNKRCLQLPTVRISPSYLLITGVGSPLVGGPGLGGWCPAPPCAPSCWHLRTHRGHTDGWPQGGQLERSCRNVGVLKVAHEQDPNISVVQVHCSGRWLLDGELLSGMKCAGSSGGLRHISRLAIDGGAAGVPDPAETNCNGSHSIGHSTATEANTNLYLVWQMHFDCFCEDLNTGTRASTLKCYCYTIQ